MSDGRLDSHAALTLLIALICDSFSAVMHVRPQEGVIVNVLSWIRSLKARPEDKDEDEDEKAETPIVVDPVERLAAVQDKRFEELGERLDRIEDALLRAAAGNPKLSEEPAFAAHAQENPLLVHTKQSQDPSESIFTV